jgi:hypothetical protein
VTVNATGFDPRFRQKREERTVSVPTRVGEREPEPAGEGGFDVPPDVLEVPSFLRDS